MKGKISLRTLENLFKEIIPENKYDDEDLLAVDESYDVKAAILNTGHIKTSILNNFPANQNQFGGQLKFSFGKNSFVSYLSFQRKDFRYLLYDVQSKEASLHNEKISISELKGFYILVIKAGLKLSIISD